MGKKRKVALTLGAAGIAAWAASKVVAKPVPREEKKALTFKKPVILANRGGLLEAPENTLAAFEKSAALGVHGFAIDVRLTKDEEILVFHDEYVDRTTDLAGKVADFTLLELQVADAGYHYKDENAVHTYRGKGEKLVTLHQLLTKFPHLFITINIKDSPDTYEGSLIPSKLWRLIEELDAQDRVVVTSVYDEQTDRFNLYAQNRVATGAGDTEVKKAYASFTSQFGHLYSPSADLFRISEKIGIFPIGTESFIKFLTNLNISVYFEEINESESMVALMKAGASGFITDAPTKAMQILQDNE